MAIGDAPQARNSAGPTDHRYQAIRRVTLIGSVVDLLLGVLKIVFGYLAQSQALVADGIHSLSDLLTDAMVIYAAKHGSKDADEEHPYGHGRIETVATVVLAVVLIIVAIGIGWDAVARLFHPDELLKPGIWALIVAVVSVASKEVIYHYTMRVALRLNSRLLKANAWHSRSDAISSIIVVIGVGGSMLGLTYLDALAAVGVALMIAKIGWDLVWQSLHELIDTALDRERVEVISRKIAAVNGVYQIHTLRTRMMGGEALVDVHIQVEPHISVSEGHFISDQVRGHVVSDVSEVLDVLVHIDPEDDEVGSPSVNLPTRDELETYLRGCWSGLLEWHQIERITLHYLAGYVEVELILPLSMSLDSAIIERIKSAAVGCLSVRKVALFYSAP